jgi:hypothetical protein
VRVELTLPSGASWSTGPDDAAERITGPAAQYCRVFVQRLDLDAAPDLFGDGTDATTTLQVARAYL